MRGEDDNHVTVCSISTDSRCSTALVCVIITDVYLSIHSTVSYCTNLVTAEGHNQGWGAVRPVAVLSEGVMFVFTISNSCTSTGCGSKSSKSDTLIM